MGRNTGTEENTQANKDATDQQKQSFARANAATDWFNQGQKQLESTGAVAANPYKNPEYLRNQNILTAGNTSAGNAGAKEALDTEASRTGVNTAGRKATLMDLARKNTMARTQYQAGQAADDYGRNLDWQKFLLGSRLAPAGVDTQMYGTATQGRDTAVTNLKDIGVAAQQSFGQMMGAAIGAAGGVATGFAPKPKAGGGK